MNKQVIVVSDFSFLIVTMFITEKNIMHVNKYT